MISCMKRIPLSPPAAASRSPRHKSDSMHQGPVRPQSLHARRRHRISSRPACARAASTARTRRTFRAFASAAPSRRGRVHGLGERLERRAGANDALRQQQQVFERPDQPIELPGTDGVAGPQVIEQPVQFGAIETPPEPTSSNTRAQPAARRAALWAYVSCSVVDTRA